MDSWASDFVNRFLPLLAVLGVVLISTACAPGDVERTLTSSGGTGSDASAGLPELTPGTSRSDENDNPSPDPSFGEISRSGQTTSSTPPSEPAGSMDSVAPQQASTGNPDQATRWSSFQEDTFRFFISYPEVFILSPETGPLEDENPDLVFRLRMQDRELANSETAHLELPQFSVEIFVSSRGVLEAFIQDAMPDANLEEYRLGDLTGFRAIDNRLAAPNEFYFFLSDGYIYKLTPLGVYGEDILQSFRVLP
jgi:hypothetical protein